MKAPKKKAQDNKQLLHLVIGGELDNIEGVTFKDLSKVDLVGVYPNYAEAERVWRAKARAIGSSGERCVSLDAPRVVGDWVGTCPAGHTSTRHRAPQRVATCSRCSRRFDLRNLIRWRYQGASVPMPERYAAELRRLLGTSGDRVVAGAPERTFAVGDIVEVVAPSSTWHGAVGEIELVGAAKCQVRFEGGDLVAVPVPVLRLADPLASEGVSA